MANDRVVDLFGAAQGKRETCVIFYSKIIFEHWRHAQLKTFFNNAYRHKQKHHRSAS